MRLRFWLTNSLFLQWSNRFQGHVISTTQKVWCFLQLYLVKLQTDRTHCGDHSTIQPHMSSTLQCLKACWLKRGTGSQRWLVGFSNAIREDWLERGSWLQCMFTAKIFLQGCRWPAAPSTAQQLKPHGLAWAEVATALSLIHGCCLPVRRVDANGAKSLH